MNLYKESFYNQKFEYKGEYFIYNPYSGLSKITRKMFDELNNVNKISDFTRKILVNKGYLVESDLDEYLKSVVLSNIKKYDLQTLSLSIIPTYNCNFSCEYCFVKKDNSIMQEHIIEDILKFIEKKFKEGVSKLLVTWIGGEPLIAFEIIKKISNEIIKLSSKYNCVFKAYLITNGSLLSQEIVNQFSSLNINGLQITIDGDEEVHNINREMIIGNSYKSILKNLEKINFSGINLSVRMNLDKNNVNHLNKLIKEIKDKNIFKKIHRIYLSPVFRTEYMSKEKLELCFDSPQEYAEFEIKIMRLLVKEGFHVDMDIEGWSTILGNIEKKLLHFGVDTYGYVYLYEKEFGNFKSSICKISELTNKLIYNSNSILESTLENNRFYTTCRGCKVFPLCMNGGLQVFECSSIKYNLIDRMKLKIDMEE